MLTAGGDPTDLGPKGYTMTEQDNTPAIDLDDTEGHATPHGRDDEDDTEGHATPHGRDDEDDTEGHATPHGR
jgi:hypothetical protein